MNDYRWYNPAQGLFLSKDPIGVSGGLHEYLYCGGDPVNKIDWSGLCTDKGSGVWETTKEVTKFLADSILGSVL